MFIALEFKAATLVFPSANADFPQNPKNGAYIIIIAKIRLKVNEKQSNHIYVTNWHRIVFCGLKEHDMN